VFSPKSKSVPLIFIKVVEFDIKKNSSASLPDEEMSLEKKKLHVPGEDLHCWLVILVKRLNQGLNSGGCSAELYGLVQVR
jgi:hypothetical protein